MATTEAGGTLIGVKIFNYTVVAIVFTLIAAGAIANFYHHNYTPAPDPVPTVQTPGVQQLWPSPQPPVQIPPGIPHNPGLDQLPPNWDPCGPVRSQPCQIV